MGKFNRPSRTRKLEKLTATLEASKPLEVIHATGSVELQKQVKEIMKTEKKKPVKQNTPRGADASNTPPVITVKEIKVSGKVEASGGSGASTPAPEKPVIMTIDATPEAIASMNVYQKIQLIRSAVADFDIKKSGSNSDKGFNYFELPDYLPMLNKLMAQIGLMTKFDMFNDKGTLKIFNTAKPEEVLEFELPTADLVMADAEGKAAEGIQIMGGKTTYMRRYLMQIAFEISVKDTVDSRAKAPAKPVDELDPRDAEALKEANSVEHLNTIAHSIRSRKGFNKGEALLKLYTEMKGKLAV